MKEVVFRLKTVKSVRKGLKTYLIFYKPRITAQCSDFKSLCKDKNVSSFDLTFIEKDKNVDEEEEEKLNKKLLGFKKEVIINGNTYKICIPSDELSKQLKEYAKDTTIPASYVLGGLGVKDDDAALFLPNYGDIPKYQKEFKEIGIEEYKLHVKFHF